LTAPAASVQQPDLRRQSRLIASKLLVVILFGLAMEGLTVLYYWDEGYTGYLLTLTVTLLLGVAYGLGRMGRTTAAVWIAILISTAGILGLTFYFGGSQIDVDDLALLFFPLLLASVFLPLGNVILLAVIYAGLMLLVPLAVPGIGLVDLIIGPVFFLLPPQHDLSARHRKLVENDRQRSLQRRRMLPDALQGERCGLFVGPEGSHISVNQKAADILGHDR
jgi:hypothetical protein